MKLRTALLAGILALVGTALRPEELRAQEIQFNVTGEVCIFNAGCTGPVLPLTASFDLNTSMGQLSPGFIPGTEPGVNTLVGLSGSNLPITNFSASVGGHRLDSPESSSASLQMLQEGGCGPDCVGIYEFFLAFPQANALLAGSSCQMPSTFCANWNFHVSVPEFTQAEYQAFKNPLFSIVTSFELPIGGGIDGGNVGNYFLLGFSAQTSVVPEPGAPPLLLLGLIGLGLSKVPVRLIPWRRQVASD